MRLWTQAPGAPTGPSTRAGNTTRQPEHAVWKIPVRTPAQDAAPAEPAMSLSRACSSLPIGADQIPDFRRLSDALMKANRLAGGRRTGPRARRRVLRASREPALSRRQFHPQRRPARIPRGARRLPRRVRPRAHADASGRSPTTSRPTARVACARSAWASWPNSRASTGTPSSSAWCSKPMACASTARALRLLCRERLRPRRPFAEPHPLRPRARDADATTASTISRRPIS